MSYNITVEGGSSARLKTAGKYCDRDIVITATGSSATQEKTALCLIRKGIGYIDTGIDGANSNLKIEIRYEFLTMPTGYWYLLRAYVSESTNSTRMLCNKDAAVYNCLNSVPSKSLAFSETRYANVVYTDILQPEGSTKFSYTTNGEKVTATRTSGTALVGETIKLFGQSSLSFDGVDIKLYHTKIYDGDVLVRDYVPHITKDGECGLYDKVTKQFYGNAGEGTFEVETAGGVAEPVIQPLEVTENGTYTAPSGVDGFSPVTVNVEASGGGNSEEDVAALLENTMRTLNNSIATKLRTRACQYASALVTVNLPSCKTIGTFAFSGCTSLTTVHLALATSITSQSFYGCTKLKHADFGAAGSIEAQALSGCSALTELILRKTGSICTLANVNALNNTPIANGTGYVYVPRAEIEEYKAATNWSTFASQFRAKEDYPEICEV